MINNILLVEDDAYKETQIVNYIKSINNSVSICKKNSINSSLAEITSKDFDLLLLDMSLPVFDTNEAEFFKPYGGLLVLDELKRLKKTIPVIIITQFSKFGEGNNEITLEQLKLQCSKKYNNFKSIIYFMDSEWKSSLWKVITEDL